MNFDLGAQGLGLLVAMSLVFGLIAQVALWRVTTHWLWLTAAAGYFLGGLFVSEVWFGTATVDDLQPMIDGLAFDEVLLGGLVFGLLAVVATGYVARRNRLHRPM